MATQANDCEVSVRVRCVACGVDYVIPDLSSGVDPKTTVNGLIRDGGFKVDIERGGWKCEKCCSVDS